jgi:glycosyltransferase involved in cell wall biosynthesis
MAAALGKKKVIVSVINDLVTDQRVKKVCFTLHDMGFEILLVGRQLSGSLPMDARPYPVRRMKLLFEKGPAFYGCFQIRLFFMLLFHHADVLVSNDLDTLLPNFLVSRLKKIPLVYDSHEYFTGVPELQHHPLKQKIWKRVEQWIFPRLKNVFTVNDSIAHLYEEEYGIRPVVVRNVPVSRQVVAKGNRKTLHLPEDKNIMILQGAGINMQRGAEEMVEAMRFVEGSVLLIVGGGDVLDSLKQMVDRWSLHEKVLFRPRQPYEKLMQYTAAADLGLTLDKNTNINYRFSLPNKIFDYLHAGIPVLASDLTEIRKVIETYDVGDFIPSHRPEAIARKVTEIFADHKKMETWRQNAIKAAAVLNWERESEKLKKVYAQYV